MDRRSRRFWFGVGFGDETVDGSLQVLDGLEDAALEAAPCELGEEAFDGSDWSSWRIW